MSGAAGDVVGGVAAVVSGGIVAAVVVDGSSGGTVDSGTEVAGSAVVSGGSIDPSGNV